MCGEIESRILVTRGCLSRKSSGQCEPGLIDAQESGGTIYMSAHETSLRGGGA